MNETAIAPSMLAACTLIGVAALFWEAVVEADVELVEEEPDEEVLVG